MKRKRETVNMQENDEEEYDSDQNLRKSSNDDEMYTFSQLTSVIWRIDMFKVVHPFIVPDSN